MKVKKFFKITFLVVLIPSSTMMSSLAIVACGKSSPAPKKPDLEWADFVEDAMIEKAPNIVDADLPSSWVGFEDNELTLGNFISDNKTKTVTVNIVRLVDNIVKTNTVFKIIYKGQDYEVKNWKYINPPVNNYSWADFKRDSQAASKNPQILKYNAEEQTQTWKTFKWGGDTTQQKWQINDVAQLDVYGGSNENDPAGGLNIMKGQWIADESTQTVSEIISIKNRQGDYDSNPIKITSTYNGSVYETIKSRFEQVAPLQSYQNYMNNFQNNVNLIDKNSPSKHDWQFFSKNRCWINNNQNLYHTQNNTLFHFLTNNAKGHITEDNITDIKFSVEQPPITDPHGLTRTIGLICHFGTLIQPQQKRFYLTSSFVFKNNLQNNINDNDNKIGNAFNYNWKFSWDDPNPPPQS